MRNLIATILAICLGILLPSAPIPVRVCLLDPAVRSEDCCGTCSASDKDCCVDTEVLPDSTLPAGSFETPAFVGYVIPPLMAELPLIPERILPPPCFARTPAGIGPPAAWLAVLNVWRL